MSPGTDTSLLSLSLSPRLPPILLTVHPGAFLEGGRPETGHNSLEAGNLEGEAQSSTWLRLGLLVHAGPVPNPARIPPSIPVEGEPSWSAGVVRSRRLR